MDVLSDVPLQSNDAWDINQQLIFKFSQGKPQFKSDKQVNLEIIK